MERGVVFPRDGNGGSGDVKFENHEIHGLYCRKKDWGFRGELVDGISRGVGWTRENISSLHPECIL